MTIKECLIIVDGLILSPTAHDHSFNYRSATFHLSQPLILPNEPLESFEEKRRALAGVTNTVVGYARTDTVGLPTGPNVSRTTVIKMKIVAVSCKQRHGGFNGSLEPSLEGDDEDVGFTGVVPCFTQWGKPLGYGKDAEEVRAHFVQRSEDGQRLADGVAWASETTRLDGLGKKKK